MTTPRRRRFRLSRKAILIAIAAIGVIELPLVILALRSTIPYHWAWVSHDDTVTIFRAYWDGHTIISEHQRTGWTLLGESAIWFFILAGIAVSGYWAVRWLKRSRSA